MLSRVCLRLTTLASTFPTCLKLWCLVQVTALKWISIIKKCRVGTFPPPPPPRIIHKDQTPAAEIIVGREMPCINFVSSTSFHIPTRGGATILMSMTSAHAHMDLLVSELYKEQVGAWRHYICYIMYNIYKMCQCIRWKWVKPCHAVTCWIQQNIAVM